MFEENQISLDTDRSSLDPARVLGQIAPRTSELAHAAVQAVLDIELVDLSESDSHGLHKQVLFVRGSCSSR